MLFYPLLSKIRKFAHQVVCTAGGLGAASLSGRPLGLALAQFAAKEQLALQFSKSVALNHQG